MIGPASIPLLAGALSYSSPRSSTVMHTSRAVAVALATRWLVSGIVLGKSSVLILLSSKKWRLQSGCNHSTAYVDQWKG